jgi:hypothetical protein
MEHAPGVAEMLEGAPGPRAVFWQGRQLQTSSSKKLAIHWTAPMIKDDCRMVELYAHRLLRRYRTVDEWFDVSVTEAMEAIQQAINLWASEFERKYSTHIRTCHQLSQMTAAAR